ncbi:hypothetical protein NDA16_001863 [Ustilago loliicola]|nr:hypothetical protein NDA16_001863 [Ustilago loliicola]
MKVCQAWVGLAALLAFWHTVAAAEHVLHDESAQSWRGAIASNDFIRVDNMQLKDSKGKPHYLTGINYWACMNLAADADAGGSYQRFITELD